MRIIGILGIIVLCMGIFWLIKEVWLRVQCSKKTQGTIVDIQVRSEMVGRASSMVHYYYPVYEFEAEGQKYCVQAEQCSKMQEWFQLGEKTTIYYNPRNPQDILVREHIGGLIGGIAMFVIGSLLTGIYVFLH